MKPIVYISGPITGKPDLNRPAFAKAAASLTASGYLVVNPFDVCQNPGSWEEAMRADIKALMDCTHIALLPDWNRSRGARIEAELAAHLGMGRIFLTQEPV
jgi:hypothetical protein